MIYFRKIKIKMVTFLGISILLIGLLLTVFIPHKPQEIKQHAVGSGNITIDYTSPLGKLDPIGIGMDLSGYGYPNVFANDQLEQQKLKSLGIKYMRLDLKYSTPGDPTSKIVCSANGCDTRWTGDLMKIPIIMFDTGLWEMNRIWQEYLLACTVRILIRIMMR